MISSRLPRASASSTSSSSAPASAGVGSTDVSAISCTEPLPSPAAGSTTSVPWSMFMPQAKPNVPARAGIRSTAVEAKAGSDADTPKSGNTTRDEHSPVSCRSKTSRSGTPCSLRMTFGE